MKFLIFFILVASLYINYYHEPDKYYSSVGATSETWEKVIKLEEKIHKHYKVPLPSKFSGGSRKIVSESTTNYVVININNKNLLAEVIWGQPKVGDCLPFKVKKLSTGENIAKIDIQKYKYSTSYGDCS